MINTNEFVKHLATKISFAAGVPDSLLKDFNTCLMETLPEGAFHTTANEGSAIALAAGYYLATGNPGLVYMQNSGIGNAINPLLSLNDSMVYGIPVLLFIGWRGEPGVKDEPQHVKQGLVTKELLESCGIKYWILGETTESAAETFDRAIDYMQKNSAPAAIIVRKGAFDGVSAKYSNAYSLKREDAIAAVLDCLDEKCHIISTTGMISRELFERRELRGESHGRDFLTVGSMGHASQIALGVALQKPDKKIVCFDGDGAMLMHMGGAATIGASGVENFLHIMFNNEAHDSVGGQPTIMGGIDILKAAEAFGYDKVSQAYDTDGIRRAVSGFISGRCFLEIKVAQGARKDLGRPSQTPAKSKAEFMERLGQA